jgi:hypothetical protein
MHGHMNIKFLREAFTLHSFTNHTAINLIRIFRGIIVREGAEQRCQYNDNGTGSTERGSSRGRGTKTFSSPNLSDRLCRPRIFLFSGSRGYFPVAERLGCDADRLIPHRPLVKNENNHSPALLICLHGVYKSIFTFSGGFAKLRKVTTSFVMCAHLSVCPHGTSRFPLDGFP